MTTPVLKTNGHTSKNNIAFMGTLVRCGNGKVRAKIFFNSTVKYFFIS